MINTRKDRSSIGKTTGGHWGEKPMAGDFRARVPDAHQTNDRPSGDVYARTCSAGAKREKRPGKRPVGKGNEKSEKKKTKYEQ